MAVCKTCNLCAQGGRFEDATESGRVPCNVRKFKEEFFTLWRCHGCDSLHCAEDADLAHYYAHYPLKDHKISFHERVGYARRLQLLERHGFNRQQRVLDYGCGVGLFIDFLREKRLPQVFGYDAFTESYADSTRLDETYDAVTTYDVIEHDDDPRAFMRRTTALVRPGGLLVVGTPRAEGVSITRAGDPSLHPPYHRHILSEKVLIGLGEEMGLKPVQVYRRSYFDSLYPTVNSRFLWRYIQRGGGFLDGVSEPTITDLFWPCPDLLFLAFFGYFLPYGDNMIVTFRKP